MKRETLNHSNEASVIIILGPGRIALWSEGRPSTVDLFEAPLFQCSDETFPDIGALEHRAIPASQLDPIHKEIDEVLSTCEARMMTPVEEFLYDILRNRAIWDR